MFSNLSIFFFMRATPNRVFEDMDSEYSHVTAHPCNWAICLMLYPLQDVVTFWYMWAGALVNMDEFCASIDAVRRENPFWETLKAAQEQSAESLLLPESCFINGHARHQPKASNRVLQNQILWKDEGTNELPYNFKWENRAQRDPNVENRSDLCAVRGGATRALEMLHEYLRALEATNRGFSRTSVSPSSHYF